MFPLLKSITFILFANKLSKLSNNKHVSKLPNIKHVSKLSNIKHESKLTNNKQPNWPILYKLVNHLSTAWSIYDHDIKTRPQKDIKVY